MELEKTQLITLKQKQETAEKIALLVKQKREEFNDANVGLFEEAMKINEEVAHLKLEIEIQAVECFYHDGIKKLTGGIGIRVGSSLDYDSNQAFTWAKEHSLCLALDKKAFEKIAKSQELDFVKKEEKVSVTFPKEILI